MNFLALIIALILRQRYPYKYRSWVEASFSPYLYQLEHNLNDGKYLHGLLAWLLGVLLPSTIIAVIYYYLTAFNAFLAIIFCTLTLYLCLRCTQFESHASLIANALQTGNIDSARAQYSAWQQAEAKHYNHMQIAELSIEHTFSQSHLYLFGPLFWFVMLGLIGLGPAPAVLYALALQTKNQWSEHRGFGFFAEKIFMQIDWLPARITASAFAIAGDFEDALFCWRSQAQNWPNQNLGIIFASGAGALGVKLGGNVLNQGIIQSSPELGLGDEADGDYLKSAISMVNRVLVLTIGFILMITLAYQLGN